MTKKIDKPFEKHGLYIVIPYKIYSQKDLSAQAKLILGEIIALLKIETPFVWASNKHFGKLFRLDKSTASYHIKKLVEKGYIKRKVFKKGCNDLRCPIAEKENHRHIYPTSALLDISNSLSSRIKKPSQASSKEDLHSEIDTVNCETLSKDKSRSSKKTSNKKKSYRCPLLLPDKYPELVKKHPNGHKECVEFITTIQNVYKNGRKFVNYAKQFKALHKMLKAGYDFQAINACIDGMDKDNFWKNKGWDFTNVANVIEKGGDAYG